MPLAVALSSMIFLPFSMSFWLARSCSWLARFCTVVAMFTAAATARAEGLVVSLSSHHVRITQTYTGAELVIFGVITCDTLAQAMVRAGGDAAAGYAGNKGAECAAAALEMVSLAAVIAAKGERR